MRFIPPSILDYSDDYSDPSVPREPKTGDWWIAGGSVLVWSGSNWMCQGIRRARRWCQ